LAAAFCLSISDVVELSAQEQVVRSNAGGNVAGMANQQGARISAVVEEVADSMRSHLSAIPPDVPIPSFCPAPGEQPASARLLHLLPESVRRSTPTSREAEQDGLSFLPRSPSAAVLLLESTRAYAHLSHPPPTLLVDRA